MIGKIVKGTSFGGCVNYVLKEEKSRLLEAVGVEGTPSEMAEQFELQTLLNDKVKNTVGHISLNFSAENVPIALKRYHCSVVSGTNVALRAVPLVAL